MGKKCDLTPRKKARIETVLTETTMNQGEIAVKYGVSQASVSRIRRNLACGEGNDGHRVGKCGRKPKSTARDDRILVSMIKTNRKLNSRQLAGMWQASGADVHDSTFRRRLLKAGLGAHRPTRKQHLNLSMIQKRFVWAKQHLHMTTDDWKKVIFSDEAVFHVMNDRTQYVRRTSSESLHPDCITSVKHPTSVMVWSAICAKSVGRLHIVSGMMNQHKYNEVLEKKMLPALRGWFPDGNCTFTHDGAPCHTAKSVAKFLKDSGIDVLSWPGNSPDQNPIENSWKIVKDRISKRHPATKTALIEALIDVWHRDPEIAAMCPKLVESMTRRVKQLHTNKGRHTRY